MNRGNAMAHRGRRMGWRDVAALDTGEASVLVVDDDPALRRVMVSALKGMLHDVRAAASAEEADVWLSARDFDLVLLDLDLPRMNGLELLRWALRRQPDLAVVMLTGHSEPGLALDCLSAGARAFLVKPIDLGFLQRAIRDALAVRALLRERNALVKGDA
ncbi:MAG TPA: response regulator [Longimicrobiales bacterium]|jgi:DNA-binding NtrC family response regulator